MRGFFRSPTGFLQVGYVKLQRSSSEKVFPHEKDDGLMIVLTASGLLQYTLLGYLDPSPGSPVDQMIYRDYPLQNCSIHKLMFGQSNIDNGLGQAEVTGPRSRELRLGDAGMQYFCESIPWVNDHRRSYEFNES